MAVTLSVEEGGEEHDEDDVSVSDLQDVRNGPTESNLNTERGS